MRNIVTAGAFLMPSTEREAGLKAKRAMLRFAGFKNWQHPCSSTGTGHYYPWLWMRPMGSATPPLPAVTPAERTAVAGRSWRKHHPPNRWALLNASPPVTNHIA